ncbi:MAG: membrane protein insertion efficiency factor YidD [Candidatus Omnitrophica bacterium]|nr:membrane protein insertion efficiency factor YidD [Candidatus Omnitrophota bacterium]
MLKTIVLKLIKYYQRYVRPALPCSCRFVPSCSEYAAQAIIKYGLFKGSILAAARLLRCHPFSCHAVDDPLV